jgi:hypothetical protein
MYFVETDARMRDTLVSMRYPRASYVEYGMKNTTEEHSTWKRR